MTPSVWTVYPDPPPYLRCPPTHADASAHRVEMTAILLIPYLVKSAKLQRGETLPPGVGRPPYHALEHVRAMMMHDIYVDQDDDGLDEDEPDLTVGLIQQILRSYGEEDLARDEGLCRDMLAQTDGHARFDATALAQALTADVRLYNVENETSYTTLYQDIFGTDGGGGGVREKDNKDKNKDDGGGTPKEDGVPDAPRLKHTYTAPAIDSVAATYRSKSECDPWRIECVFRCCAVF